MPDQTPYVVDNRWIVYAHGTMDAAAKYRRDFNSNAWPVVRQAFVEDLEQLQPLPQAEYRKAA